MIFDYCGNFEYFRERKEGDEARETKTLSENIFGKQIKILMALQESTFAGDSYQVWRNELVETCYKASCSAEPGVDFRKTADAACGGI